MEKLDRRALVYIAVFGTFWGLVEASLGSILHAFRLPFTGSILSGIGLIILLTARSFNDVRGSSFLMGLIAATIKIIGFSTVKLGPFVGITMEGILVDLALSVSGIGWSGFLLAGFLVGSWPLLQTIITKTIMFGSEFIPVILELAQGFSDAVGLPLGWWLLALYVLLHISLGIGAAVLSWLIRKKIQLVMTNGQN